MKSQLAEKYKRYPEFMRIVDLIGEQNPLQGKRIQAFITTQDENYWMFAEDLSTIINRAFINDESGRKEIADSYNDLCMGMLREQIRFRKTGVYPRDDASATYQNIYNQPNVMYRYVVGLLISQMLWPNHYRLFRFFQDVLTRAKPSSYLEIGAGHGLFVLEALRRFPRLEVVICDISKTSIEISKKILLSFGLDLAKVQFVHKDFWDFSSNNRSFDFITLSEVLEHVQDPIGFMKRVRKFLLSEGVIYMSTCANCPAVDHLYHFHSVEEMRKVFYDSKFLIADEIALPAEDVPRDVWEEQLVTINYAAKLLLDETGKD